MLCSFHLSYNSVYFPMVVHAAPGEGLIPKPLAMLTAPARIRPSSPQGLGYWVAHWSRRGLDSLHPPPPVPHPRSTFAPQWCFPAGLGVTAPVSPHSCGAGSPGVPCRSCEAGGGLGRPPGAAETAGCCYQPLHRGQVGAGGGWTSSRLLAGHRVAGSASVSRGLPE